MSTAATIQNHSHAQLLELFRLSFMERWEEATPIKAKRQEPRSRGLMQEESHAIVSRTRTRASQSRTRTRATQSRGPLQQETHASKPHPYKHVHAQLKAVVPCNRSRTHQSRTRTNTYTRNTKPWSLATGFARIVKPSKHAKQSPSTFLEWRVDVVS